MNVIMGGRRAAGTVLTVLLFLAVQGLAAGKTGAGTRCGLGPVDPDEMRITFMGTSFLPRLSQEANSVFVECGEDGSFVFDCGSGVISKYISVGVAYSQMDKIFLTHLHGDHMSDLMFIYLFGPSGDRLTDLHVWGPTGPTEEDGITAFCGHLYEMTYWHRESFSFLSTGLTNGQDGYNLVPHECSYLDAMQSIIAGHGAPVAYDSNNVKISYFPMIHDRDGAIAYKLEWRGLKMIFSGDSLPNTLMIDQAQDADVLIHELTLSPEVWAQKNSGLTPDPNSPFWVTAVNKAKLIQNASHTPARAFGYIMSRTNPRLAVATHFQNQSDTVGAVKDDINVFYPYEDDDDPPRVLLATDLIVIEVPVDKSPIQWWQAVGDPDAFQTTAKWYSETELAPPKYAGNRDQFSPWLKDLVINPQIYDASPPGDSGDYDGDGISDIAVFRSTSGLWSIRGITRGYFGASSDMPVPGDYNGDGTTELAVFRPSTGLWAVNGVGRFIFGETEADVPVPRDYDGDSTTDIAVFRGATGRWAIRGISSFNFGSADDVPVPGYYSGPAAVPAVFRPLTGRWIVRNLTSFYFGSAEDTPVPGDYNGDGHWEAAVFPYSGGLWAIRGITRAYFGKYSDSPSPGRFGGGNTDRIGLFRDSTSLWAVKGITQIRFGNFDDVPATR